MSKLLWLWIKETLWWNIWGNQILFWYKDWNIGYLSIYCSCWNTLNSILRTSLYMKYLVLKYQYHAQMQLKTLLYLTSIIKKMHIEQIYLGMLSHKLRKLEWIWYIFQFNFWCWLFQSINSLLLIGYIDLDLIKNQTFLIKVL